jgi:hypothetical protein
MIYLEPVNNSALQALPGECGYVTTGGVHRDRNKAARVVLICHNLAKPGCGGK